MKPKRNLGYIRWYDERSDDGILSDLDGNQYYFNSWSFLRTHRRVTGISKKTGRKITIKTRLYPGLWISFQHIKDPQCRRIKTDQAVTFIEADLGCNQWAVSIEKAPRGAASLVAQAHIVGLLDCLMLETNPIWLQYLEKKLDRKIEELWR